MRGVKLKYQFVEKRSKEDVVLFWVFLKVLTTNPDSAMPEGIVFFDITVRIGIHEFTMRFLQAVFEPFSCFRKSSSRIFD